MMSSPVLPDGVPEIDTNLVSFPAEESRSGPKIASFHYIDSEVPKWPFVELLELSAVFSSSYSTLNGSDIPLSTRPHFTLPTAHPTFWTCPRPLKLALCFNNDKLF